MSEQTSQLAVAVSERDHAQGPDDAPVTLVEYGDYECGHCAASLPAVNRLRQEMGPRLRLVFRHFPLNSIHPHASVAAQAAEAAGAQGRFWEMHELLFANQHRLAEVDYLQLAMRLGLEIYRFDADLSSGRFASRVAQDRQSGKASGVTGTPTFFINGAIHTDISYDSLREAIQRKLDGR